MSMFNLKTAALAIVAGVGLSGCAYGPYGGLGVGASYGNGYYDPYYNNGGYYGAGYGTPYGSGYGNGYGYPYGSGYGYPYGSGYGYPYGSSYYGWNNGYYYPGTGYYVYDRDRRPHRWTDAQRRYWERQRSVATSSGGVSRILENWADFQNGPQAASTANNSVRQRRFERERIIRERPVASSPQVRTERRAEPSVQQERREARAETSVQQERREARAEARNERRGNRGQNRRVDKD